MQNKFNSLNWFLLDATIINSFILYKETVKKPMSHIQFRLQLSKELIGQFTARKKAGRPRPCLPTGSSHVLDHIFDKLIQQEHARSCKNCKRKPAIPGAKRKKPVETRFGRHGCSVLLCQLLERGNCFEEWHKSLQEGENSESA